jgi:enoyl-CoA hydratase
MSDQIQLARDGMMAAVVLDRPAKLNAPTRPMGNVPGDAIDRLSAVDPVRCFMRRGARKKFFSPGNQIADHWGLSHE